MARTGTVRLCHLPVVVWFPRNAREAGEHTHPTNRPDKRKKANTRIQPTCLCHAALGGPTRRRGGGPAARGRRGPPAAAPATRRWPPLPARATESAVRFVSACSRHRPRRRRQGVPARDAVHTPRPSTSPLSPRRHPRAPAMGPAHDGVRAAGGARLLATASVCSAPAPATRLPRHDMCSTFLARRPRRSFLR